MSIPNVTPPVQDDVSQLGRITRSITVFGVYDCGDLDGLYLTRESAEKRQDKIRESCEQEFWDNIIVFPVVVEP